MIGLICSLSLRSISAIDRLNRLDDVVAETVRRRRERLLGQRANGRFDLFARPVDCGLNFFCSSDGEFAPPR